MENTIIQTKERAKRDILHHLNGIATNASRLQLEYNRDKIIWHYAENTIREINISKNLLETGISPFVLDLKNQVNELFQSDKNLSTVIVKIVNPNRPINNDAIAYLNFQL